MCCLFFLLLKKVEEGRQVWRYRMIDDPIPPQNPIASKYLVGLPTPEETPVLPPPKTVEDALRNAVSFFGIVVHVNSQV